MNYVTSILDKLTVLACASSPLVTGLTIVAGLGPAELASDAIVMAIDLGSESVWNEHDTCIKHVSAYFSTKVQAYNYNV